MKIPVLAVVILFAALMSCGPGGPEGRSPSTRSDVLINDAFDLLMPENLDIAVAEVDGTAMVPSLQHAEDLVLEALKKANWNQKEAAALLGISVDRMNSRVRKFGIKHPSWRVHK